MASTLQGVTAKKSLFCSDLFHLRAGVPAELALMEASTFLASAEDLARTLQDTVGGDIAYAAVCMIDLAKGLIDGTLSGSMEKNHGQAEAADRRHLAVLDRIVRFAGENVLMINPEVDELVVNEARQFLDWAQRRMTEGDAA
jgi:hypothetical protein